MALIICSNCGKKISDTTEKCVHCGCPTKHAVEEISQNCIQDDANKNQAAVVYAYLDNYQKEKLEKEFLASDKWARKYQRNSLEAPSFATPLFVCVFSALMILFLYFKIAEGYIADDPINPEMLELSIALFVSLGVLTVAMFIYSIVIQINFALKRDRFVYMKKFQLWLLVNKNIEYDPPVYTLREKKIFDNIKLK